MSVPTPLFRDEQPRGRDASDRGPKASAAQPATSGADARRAEIRARLREYLEATTTPLDTRQLELVRSSYDVEEICAALDVMLDDRLTMGAKVDEFERRWAAHLGTSCNLMVNSGSSANLLALAALSFRGTPGHLEPGDEVLIGAVAWSTSVFPIVQMGCVPVFVDVDPGTFNVDPVRLEQAITPRTRAILAVHILGNPCDMTSIMKIAERHGLWVIEDCCEAVGAMVDGKPVGTFGDLATFSFFFSHHITTIEGGMISSKAPGWADLLTSLRAHGWVRGRTDREVWERRYPDIDGRWLFVAPGYNVRPTEISAAIGLVQLAKLPGFIASRDRTRHELVARLEDVSTHLRPQVVLPRHAHAAFGLGLMLDEQAPFSRRSLQQHLESRGIQTRPIVSANFVRHPVIGVIPYRVAGSLSGADAIHERGLMIGNHHGVTAAQIDYVVDTVAEFEKTFASSLAESVS